MIRLNLTKKSVFCIILFILPFIAVTAQIGINNTDPKSVLDISASDQTDPASTDGILIPKVDKFPDTDPGVNQHGMMVFLTTTDGSDDPGFYYWNWSVAGSSGTWDWVNRLEKIDDLTDGKSDSNGLNDGSSVF